MIYRTLILLLFLPALQAETLTERTRALLAEHPDARVVPGADGWRFLSAELRHIALGTDWIAPETPPDPPHADPLPALRRLRAELAELGIPLLIVPVPAKARLVPEAIGARASEEFPFLEQLEKEEFATVNLLELFRNQNHKFQLYCKTDTHWSPQAAQLAAHAVGKAVQSLVNRPEEPAFTLEPAEFGPIQIRGDLAAEGEAPESLPGLAVIRTDGGSLIDSASPILLLGDSHTLVFGDGGDMHARNSGFTEHLARETGHPIDRIANRGSASTPPRMTVFRQAARDAQWLESKKIVIYLFTERELTQSLNGWRELPLSPRFR